MGASSFQELMTLHSGSMTLPGSPPSVQTEQAQWSSLNQPSAIATKNTMLPPKTLQLHLVLLLPLDWRLGAGAAFTSVSLDKFQPPSTRQSTL